MNLISNLSKNFTNSFKSAFGFSWSILIIFRNVVHLFITTLEKHQLNWNIDRLDSYQCYLDEIITFSYCRRNSNDLMKSFKYALSKMGFNLERKTNDYHNFWVTCGYVLFKDRSIESNLWTVRVCTKIRPSGSITKEWCKKNWQSAPSVTIIRHKTQSKSPRQMLYVIIFRGTSIVMKVIFKGRTNLCTYPFNSKLVHASCVLLDSFADVHRFECLYIMWAVSIFVSPKRAERTLGHTICWLTDCLTILK